MNKTSKILMVLVILLSLGILGIYAKMISLEKNKNDQDEIIVDKVDPPTSEEPDTSSPHTPEEEPPTKEPDVESPKPPAEKDILVSKYLSQEEVIEIALKKVGLGATLVDIESDLDDNPPKYELEIILGDYEYEIEIHAQTGLILDFDKDERDQ